MPKLPQLVVASALLSTCAMAFGAPVDEALVARFEAARVAEEQQKIAVEINQGLADGPISGALKERLIEVLASSPSLGHSRYTAILQALGAPTEFSVASINAIAAGLVTDGITHDWPAYEIIRKILTAYQQAHGLPGEGYARLKQALRSQRPYWIVIEVLATIAEDDPRHGDAFAAIVSALGEHDHYGIRSAAIAAIQQMTSGRSLSVRTLSALQQSALSDEYISVRLEAIELLTKQKLSAQRQQIVGRSLAQELVAPTPGLWQRSPSKYSLADRYMLAIELLTKLYEPPYPDHVIDALIMQTKSFAADQCVELLRANRPAGGFSDDHRKKLEAIAAGHHNDALRAALFELVAPQLDANSLQRTVNAFANETGSSARLTAGFALLNHYGDSEVPAPVVDLAERILRTAKDDKLQRVAAILIARGDEAFASREQKLLASLSSSGPYASAYHGFVELYGEDRFEDLLVRYAADTSVPVWFRSNVILALGQRATADATLSGPAKDALLQAAQTTSDYQLINAVQSALTAWRIKVPMTVHLKSKSTHSKALFGLLILCTVINLLVCLVVLVRIFTAPRREGAGVAKRIYMALGWLLLSVGMLVLLAFAVIGFLGHNSLPSPRDTLMVQIPAYIGTVVYLIIAWLIFVATKNKHKLGEG